MPPFASAYYLLVSVYGGGIIIELGAGAGKRLILTVDPEN
jgi:hypothetical protein